MRIDFLAGKLCQPCMLFGFGYLPQSCTHSIDRERFKNPESRHKNCQSADYPQNTDMQWNSLGFILTFDELFSGLVGAVIGGFMALAAVYWQTGEVARHNLRSVVTKMGVHIKQCKGIEGHRTEPWTVYMDEALSAFNRYRAFVLLPWNRKRLDHAWRNFQGADPDGTSPFSYTPTAINITSGWKRADDFLRFLDKRSAAEPSK